MPTNEIIPPKKLIVATCAPTTVFGKFATVSDEKVYDAILQLGLPTPFCPRKEPDGSETEPGDAQLKPGDCRLDLSGDVHHYARYWGPRRPGSCARPGAKRPAPSAESYASVVSGLGGAFHHPTRTYLDEVSEQTLYPNEVDSTKALPSRLARRPPHRQGRFHLAGRRGRRVRHHLRRQRAAEQPRDHQQFHLDQTARAGGRRRSRRPDDPEPVGALSSTQSVCESRGPRTVRRSLPASTAPARPTTRWTPPEVSTLQCSDEDKNRLEKLGRPVYFYWPCRVPWPRDYLFGLVLFLVAPPILIALIAIKRVFQGPKSSGPAGQRPQREPAGGPSRFGNRRQTCPGDLGLDHRRHRGDLDRTGVDETVPRAHHTLRQQRGHLLDAGVDGGGRGPGASGTAKSLFKRSHKHGVTRWDWALVWVLPVAGLFVGSFGLWSFGKNNLPALLTSDIVFIVVGLGALVGITALPFMPVENCCKRAPPRHGVSGRSRSDSGMRFCNSRFHSC